MKNSIKSLIAAAAFLFAAFNTHAQQLPGGCITNITLTPVNGSLLYIPTPQGRIQTNAPIQIDSGSVGYSCGDTAGFTVYNPCEPFTRVAAVLSWQCYGQCGSGGSMPINLPPMGDECPIWIEYCGDCCLTLCQGTVRACSGGEQ